MKITTLHTLDEDKMNMRRSLRGRAYSWRCMFRVFCQRVADKDQTGRQFACSREASTEQPCLEYRAALRLTPEHCLKAAETLCFSYLSNVENNVCGFDLHTKVKGVLISLRS